MEGVTPPAGTIGTKSSGCSATTKKRSEPHIPSAEKEVCPLHRPVCARAAGPAAWAFLSRPAGGAGQVLAVYRRSLLWLAGLDEPLTLAWDPALRGPLTLEVDSPVTRVAPGDRVTRTGSWLSLGPHAVVDLSAAVQHDPILPYLAPDRAVALARALEVATAWGDETLRHRAAELAAALQLGNPPAVDRLIGLGRGLTPSGDDFLAGMLAALQATGSPAAGPLSAAILPALGRTTLVARHFLKWAVQRRYSEVIRSVFASAGADADVADLLATGATSGADTAAGIRAGLILYRRFAVGENGN